MSSSQNIASRDHSSDPAPTPQNTPLDNQILKNRPADMGKPTVADIGEGEEEDGEEDVGGFNPASLLAQNPALLALAQDKLGSLVGQSSGYIEALPPAVRRRIDGLKGVQAEHTKVETEFQIAILELEKKFASKFAPLYTRRAEIIAGAIEPTDAEVEAGKASDSDIESDDEEEEGAKISEISEGGDDAKDKDVKGIPAFWLTALRNHMPISETIEEKDEEALKALKDIRLSYLDDKPGFKLHFTFDKNDFFEDGELTKTYYYQETVGYGGDFVYDRAVGSEIKWKEEKDLTKKVEIKKQRNKATGRTRVIRKTVNTESFFNFFSPPKPPTPEILENPEFDPEELEELDQRLELDYQLGEEFKEKVIPRAVDYFTGKALRYDGDFEDDEEFDDEDFDDEDDEDEDDEDDEDGAAPQGKQEECKQQ